MLYTKLLVHRFPSQIVLVLVIDLCPWLGVSIAMADQT
jgi:hypothetical protein